MDRSPAPVPRPRARAVRRVGETQEHARTAGETLALEVRYADCVRHKQLNAVEVRIENRSGRRLVTEEMARERVSPEELVSEMRRAGVERLEDVRWAVLEPGGKIAIIREDPGTSGPPPEEDERS